MDNPKLRPRRWHRLDNTANLFPVIASKRFSNVYRLSITLEETVVPELLQKALEIVLPSFAAFKVRMRRGVFWRYFETNPETPQVYEEDNYPCTYIDPRQNRNFLFRVTYYHKRINLEIFHVLTDGTGGMQLLRALCCRYLILAHPDCFTEKENETNWLIQHAGNTEDSYLANYVPTKKSDFRIGRGYKLTGERSVLDDISVTHAYMPVSQLIGLCRQKNVTISQFIVAAIGWGIFQQQLCGHPPKHPVNIFMPVNLRNLFPSTTALNFFSNIYISFDFKKENLTFDDMLEETKKQFTEKLTKENMLSKISYTVGSGYSPFIRVVPLPLKNLVLRIIFEASANSSTIGFSNLGKITVPDIFTPYVTGASFLLSCAPREPLKCSLCSYGDTLCFSFSSLLRSTTLERDILRFLTGLGLDITIQTNGAEYENL